MSVGFQARHKGGEDRTPIRHHVLRGIPRTRGAVPLLLPRCELVRVVLFNEDRTLSSILTRQSGMLLPGSDPTVDIWAHLKTCRVHLEPVLLVERRGHDLVRASISNLLRLVRLRTTAYTFVIIPRQLTTSASTGFPCFFSSATRDVRRLSRWSSVVSSSFWKVAKPSQRVTGTADG